MLGKKYNYLKYQILYVKYIFLILQWINIVKSIYVSNENEFKKALESGDCDIILQSSFSLRENYTIDSYNNNIKIYGKTKDITLNFINEQDGFYFNTLKTVEISNLKYIGNINLKNCNNTIISNVKYNGLIHGNNSNILFYNSTYFNTQDNLSLYGVYLNNSSFEIKESSLYGSKSILKYILFITVEVSKNKSNNIYSELKIMDSYLSGEYVTGIIKADSHSIINIQNTEFIKGYSSDNGSILNAINSSIIINECTIKDNFSDISGGSFYLENNNSFIISNSNIFNSTATLDGGIFYIAEEKKRNIVLNDDYPYKILNITANNMSKIHSNDGFGMILCIKKFGQVWLENFKGENYSCGKRVSCSALAISNNSELQIDLLYVLNTGRISINDSTFENIYTEKTDGLFYCNSCKIFRVTGIELNNAIIIGSMFYIGKSADADLSIVGSIFENINSCNELNGNECLKLKNKIKSNEDVVLFKGPYEDALVIERNTFINIYEYSGFRFPSPVTPWIYITFSYFENCYFEKSLIYVVQDDKLVVYNNSFFLVLYSIFKNIYSYDNGAIVNIPINTFESYITFNHTTIENTKSNISYSLNINTEALIKNKKKLISEFGKESFVTNPMYIKPNNTNTSLSIFSGNSFSDKISFNLYDDYNNLINMGSIIDDVHLEEIFFFKLELKDQINTKLIGQTTNYCFGTECVLPNFRGKFSPFKNNEYSIDFTINQCNVNGEVYKNNAYRDSPILKSCFIPKCEPSCINGLCINDNVCNCTNPLFTGNTCSEYYELKRIKSYDIIMRVISSILMIHAIYLIVKVIIYRKHDVIKEGGNIYYT
ncbi:hypothetical protein BCR36DRAFT_372055 [Piromyces finnis]|uniref:EGF-like domain-containing protein n=1 Tax=Piromyces finnis TaxID=1754191 RepID=A0A1Y1V3Q1_9FUNG|nr:hypothetical protein BCR36DRAFT_372055 [Piromyces finnis]|eukprot:ORX46593.1 hypothetical protein BCR36DRAFT_372055 [Piromyces finnis]